MGITNINMLQHPEDVAYLTSDISNNYYIHALANMGQRMGVYDDTAIKYNTLKYDNDLKEDIKINRLMSDVFQFETDLTFEISINNIETYKRKSQVLDNGKDFKMLLFGKLLGTDDDDDNNIEIQYTHIDIESNTILETWRAFYLKNDVYILMHLLYNTTTYNSIRYELKTYKCFIDRSQTDIRKCFKASTYDAINVNEEELSNILADLQVDLIGSEYGFFYKLLYGEDNKSYNNKSLGYSVYTESIINNNYTLQLSYDTINEDSSEQYIKITDASFASRSYENVHDVLYFDVYGIDKRIHIMNIDLIKVYPNILKYYSETRFNLNNTRLKNIIIRSIYNELYFEYYLNRIINEADEDDTQIPTLTVKPEFEIVYLSKVDNALKIYYTNDIYISFRNYEDNTNDNSPISFKYGGNSKISVYNLSVNYNSHYPEFIDSIDVIKKYTLPYINDSKFWVINDVATTNYAMGENAGNPNIMILKTSITNGKVSHSILNRFDIYDEDLEYEDLYDSNITDNTKQNYYQFYVPKIRYGNSLLKYANLIIISDVVRNISDKESREIKLAEPITTLWTIDEKNNKFVLVKDTNDNPITLNSLMSMDTYLFNKLNEYNSTNNCFSDLIALKVYHNLLIQDTLSANESDSFRLLTLSTKKNSDFSVPEKDFNYNHIYWQLNTEAGFNDPYNIHMSYTIFNEDNKYITLNKKYGSTSAPYAYYIDIINEQVFPITPVGEKLATELKISTSPYSSVNNSNSNNTSSSTNDSTSTFGQEANIGVQTDGSLLDLYSDNINDSDNASIEDTDDTSVVISNNGINESIPINYVIKADGKIIYITPNNIPVDSSIKGYYKEYIPTAYVPMMDMAEILTLNQNNINRLNVLSFDKENKIYYSYIGSSFDEDDKSTLHISSINTNINAGTNTLFSQIDEFNIQDKLNVEFSYINIKSNIIDIPSDIITHNKTNDTKTIQIITLPSEFFIIDSNENTNTKYQRFIGFWFDDTKIRKLISYITNLFNIKGLNGDCQTELETNIRNHIKGYTNNGTLMPSKKIPGYYADKFVIFDDPIYVTAYYRYNDSTRDTNENLLQITWLYSKLFY